MTSRCQKQHRDPLTVSREVGRLLGQNTRAARLLEVFVETAENCAPKLTWQKIPATRNWATLNAGCDLFRSKVRDWSDEDLWRPYIQLTQAEAAFRFHESDLERQPVWHQKESRVREVNRVILPARDRIGSAT